MSFSFIHNSHTILMISLICNVVLKRFAFVLLETFLNSNLGRNWLQTKRHWNAGPWIFHPIDVMLNTALMCMYIQFIWNTIYNILIVIIIIFDQFGRCRSQRCTHISTLEVACDGSGIQSISRHHLNVVSSWVHSNLFLSFWIWILVYVLFI